MLNFEGIWYQGSFKDGMKHGKGILYLKGESKLALNFTKYQGEFKFNNYHGHGRLVLEDGYVYEGGFVNGLKQGLGREKTPAGVVVKQGLFDNNNLVELD